MGNECMHVPIFRSYFRRLGNTWSFVHDVIRPKSSLAVVVVEVVGEP